MEPRRSNSTSAHPPVVSSGGGGLSGILNIVLSILLIVTSVVGIIYLGLRLSNNTNGSAVKSKQYQALFLTNGQVYFGHIHNVDSSYVKLSDIYYLQVQQAVQPADNKATNASSNPNVSLAKLGSELHGPEDSMYVSRDQVLFWENLKDDGKVVQAIKDYQSGSKK